MWNLIMTLRMNVWVMIDIGMRAVVLWALIIALLRAILHNLKGSRVMVMVVLRVMEGSVNVLLGVIRVRRAIVLSGWTVVLLGMTVQSLSQLIISHHLKNKIKVITDPHRVNLFKYPFQYFGGNFSYII